MNNEFEPINSNLLGEDMSNFSFRNLFKRRKHKKNAPAAEVKKTTITTVTTTPVKNNPDNSYPPMVVDEKFDYMKNSPTYDVTAKEDIQLYGIKNPSTKALKAGQRAMIKLVNGKTKENGVFLVVLEKGGNKDEFEGKYMPSYYHPFIMDNVKSGGQANTIEDVLTNFFTVNVNKQNQITE